jgi:hypothetical protein
MVPLVSTGVNETTKMPIPSKNLFFFLENKVYALFTSIPNRVKWDRVDLYKPLRPEEVSDDFSRHQRQKV